MSNHSFKLLIPTSGLGSRLGDITKYTNKALVRVGKKPAISYIIDSYPEDIEIVITLRHFADHIKDFLSLAYPRRRFTFVKEPQTPSASRVFSMGLSMWNARRHLQCPFVVHCCDTLTPKRHIFAPKSNWSAGYIGSGATSYSTITMYDDYIQRINAKGALDYDFLHIGIVGVKDFEGFWQSLRFLLKTFPKDSSMNDCQVINHMIQQGYSWKVKKFSTWFDVGNVEGLRQARTLIYDKFENLDKVDESIFLFDDFVIKFFANPQMVTDKIIRAKLLKSLVPKVEASKSNFFRYQFARGKLYSRSVTPTDFDRFLKWSQRHLWKQQSRVPQKQFLKQVKDFYFVKTQDRLTKFYQATGIADTETVINDCPVPTLESLLESLDKNWLSQTEQYTFHGDFILDNIIQTDKKYVLLDWRQNFGGFHHVGDIYYDFACLNHNLTINHDIINRNLFTIKSKGSHIVCDVLRPEKLVDCQRQLHQFILANGFDLKKTQIITAIKWLNMSPLHHHPFNLFLYYFGKYKLWKAINEN